MSIAAVKWALRAKLDEPILKLVLVTIAEVHNAKTGECFPSQSYIAEVTGRSERSIRSYLAQLEAAGLYSRKHRYQNGRRTADGFVLNMTTGIDIAGSVPAAAIAGSEAALPAKNELATGKNQPATGNVAAGTIEPDSRTGILEPESIGTDAPRPEREDLISDEQLDRFINTYPRAHVTFAREPIRKELAKAILDGADFEEIVSVAGKYRTQQSNANNIGTCYIKAPVNWLREKTWTAYAHRVGTKPILWVDEDSPQWRAWVAHYRGRGEIPPSATDLRKDGKLQRGYWFESEWPPPQPLPQQAA